jgi:hypothetical protein
LSYFSFGGVFALNGASTSRTGFIIDVEIMWKFAIGRSNSTIWREGNSCHQRPASSQRNEMCRDHPVDVPRKARVGWKTRRFQFALGFVPQKSSDIYSGFFSSAEETFRTERPFAVPLETGKIEALEEQ